MFFLSKFAKHKLFNEPKLSSFQSSQPWLFRHNHQSTAHRDSGALHLPRRTFCIRRRGDWLIDWFGFNRSKTSNKRNRKMHLKKSKSKKLKRILGLVVHCLREAYNKSWTKRELGRRTQSTNRQVLPPLNVISNDGEDDGVHDRVLIYFNASIHPSQDRFQRVLVEGEGVRTIYEDEGFCHISLIMSWVCHSFAARHFLLPNRQGKHWLYFDSSVKFCLCYQG